MAPCLYTEKFMLKELFWQGFLNLCQVLCGPFYACEYLHGAGKI